MDKDVVHIYNGILLSHKKEQKRPFAATWMQHEIVILSDNIIILSTKIIILSQKEKDKYHMVSLICGT